MADSTTPTPAPAPKKRKSPGPLNQAMLDRLQKDEEIINAALDETNNDPAFAAALAPHFLDRDNTVAITPAILTAIHLHLPLGLPNAFLSCSTNPQLETSLLGPFRDTRHF